LMPYREECMVAVFDVDGVLLESDVFGGYRARELGVAALRELLSLGYRVYVVTGRPASRRDETVKQLAEAGVTVGRLSGIYFDEWGVGEVAAKLRWLERIMSKEGCIGEYHDDNPSVLEAVGRRAGSLILHYPWGCEAMWGHSASMACGGRAPSRAIL